MRKPEAEIFQHAADLLGLPPEQCIFIETSRRTSPRRRPAA